MQPLRKHALLRLRHITVLGTFCELCGENFCQSCLTFCSPTPFLLMTRYESEAQETPPQSSGEDRIRGLLSLHLLFVARGRITAEPPRRRFV